MRSLGAKTARKGHAAAAASAAAAPHEDKTFMDASQQSCAVQGSRSADYVLPRRRRACVRACLLSVAPRGLIEVLGRLTANATADSEQALRGPRSLQKAAQKEHTKPVLF